MLPITAKRPKESSASGADYADLLVPLTSTLSLLYPMLGNPLFPPGVHYPIFHFLRRCGRFQDSHFLTHSKWPALSELMDPAGPYQMDQLEGSPVVYFFWSLPPPDTYCQTPTTFETNFSEDSIMPNTLAATYHYWSRHLTTTI